MGCLVEIDHRLISRQEFSKLKDDETIYKLIGPVLLKQEKAEAESTVTGRLEFIGKEMWVSPTANTRGRPGVIPWLVSYDTVADSA